MHLVKDYHDADVVIHNGKFHVDEMLALKFYEIGIGHPDISVARVCKVPNDFHGVCIDIGDEIRRTDLKAVFDHHKKKTETEKYAACGKVFERYKNQILPKLFGQNCNLKFAERVFKSDILDPIQAQDNYGCSPAKDIVFKDKRNNVIKSETKVVSFSSAIQKLNPTYMDENKINEYFEQAYKTVSKVIDAYCKSLSERIISGQIKDIPNASNFIHNSFHCDSKFFKFATYPPNAAVIALNMQLSEQDVSAYYNNTRQFLISDICKLNDPDMCSTVLSEIIKGYERFQDGFEKSEPIMNKHLEDAEKHSKAVLVLEEFTTWRSGVVRANNDYNRNVSVDLVIFPSARGKGLWHISPVPEGKLSNTNRVDFPEKLRGATEETLNAFSPGLCYVSGCIATATSKEAAINFAKKVIAQERTFIIPKEIKDTADLHLDIGTRTALRKLVIPEAVENIASNSLQRCYNIKELHIPAGTEIGKGAFAKCLNLESLKIEHGITSIGSFAFADCGKLKNISLPDSLEYINSSVFKNCDSIKNVTINMSSFQNAHNVIKIGNAFPNADIAVDCTAMGFKMFTFADYKQMLQQAEQRIHNTSLNFTAQIRSTGESHSPGCADNKNNINSESIDL